MAAHYDHRFSLEAFTVVLLKLTLDEGISQKIRKSISGWVFQIGVVERTIGDDPPSFFKDDYHLGGRTDGRLVI